MQPADVRFAPKADVSRRVCEGVVQGRSVVTVPSEAPRRFSGGALRSVRWGEVLSSVIGSQASTESLNSEAKDDLSLLLSRLHR